jgi:peroxiredoxin
MRMRDAERARDDARILPHTFREEAAMVSQTIPPGAAGWPAAAFDLPGTDGRRHTLDTTRGSNGLVVMFICNHCPYVKVVIDKIVRDTDELRALGIGSIAIMSNDPAAYAEDSFENMKAVAERHRFGFPYVFDAIQNVAKAYGAICTPDFFGFDKSLALVYRGRLDASGRSPDPGAARELFAAMAAVARGASPPSTQQPSIGCSIKWRQDG